MRVCGGVVVTAGVSVFDAISQKKVVKEKRRQEEGNEAEERQRSSAKHNINREEMKQHPLFFSAYSLCLRPGIDNITPDIFVTLFNCLTGDEAHTRTHTD